MRIYADTSFLVSWLYGKDTLHSKARRWFSANSREQWLVSPWSEFETINSLRSLCVRRPGPAQELTEALRRLFKRIIQTGRMEKQEVDWDLVLRDAAQISAARAATMKCRSADILHVAILEQFNPDIFVSGDSNQVALARTRGFNGVIF